MAVVEAASQASLGAVAAQLQRYVGIAGHWEEAVAPDGQIRPHWRTFLETLAGHAPAEIQGRQDLCRSILRESGVTYLAPGGETAEERSWQLDAMPLLISPTDWHELSAGVAQRARLLNAILADIYGPQRLLQSGELPPELVFANPSFVHAAHGLRPADDIYLHVYAVDVARSPDGKWWVIGDRTDTPSGAGYALENRIVLNRVYPHLIATCQVQRLAAFFQKLREGLLKRANAKGGEPRIVIFTPGPYHSTYFEQSYLARYLGFNLVEGRDLTVRDEVVYLKTLSGLLPIDVILRRVDSDYCDPLELRDDSLLGIPGLLQAARAGNVVLANSIGAGVVESPALLPFLPNLCQSILGEPLAMPPVATWWCGQEPVFDNVASQIERLVIKHAYNGQTFLPGAFKPAEMVERIKAAPHMYLAQEYVKLSTSPTWQNQQLLPRYAMIRLYATATAPGEYAVMAGGLTRASNSPESILLTAQTGGGSKDTWVISESSPDTTTLLTPQPHSTDLSRAGFALPSRMADDLYWLGRYVERIEFGCRLARCLLQRVVDESEAGVLANLMALADLLTFEQHTESTSPDTASLEEMIDAAVFDRRAGGSVSRDVEQVRRIALGVRDRLSIDAWRILTDMCDEFANRKSTRLTKSAGALTAIEKILEHISAFGGQVAECMTRDKGWMFLDIGRRLERVMDLARLLNFTMQEPDANEPTRLSAVLEIANSAMTYRSRYVAGPDAARVLDLLLADESNPRSIGFQLATLFQRVAKLRPDQDTPTAAPEVSVVTRAFSDLRLVDVDALTRDEEDGKRVQLAKLLDSFLKAMEELSSLLTRSFFTHLHASRSWCKEER
jgi:uncharacterized circularly permuted ATP-grasp superfamily protein/uncharacterized alpha-E superfamily protein